jgi:FkbM family methyltransferase
MAYFIKNTEDAPFLIDTGDVIGSCIYRFGSWEKNIEDVYKTLIKEDNLCVNVGANMGYHTIKMAKISKGVVAFEPQVKIYNQLCSNVYLNEMDDKIDCLRYALGDSNENSRLETFDNNPSLFCGELKNYGGMSINENSKGEEITITTLDSFDFRPDFILMDAEGYEDKILVGGNRMIRECKPTILLEAWSTKREDIFSQLRILDYEIYWREDFFDNFIAVNRNRKDFEEQKETLRNLKFGQLEFSYKTKEII